MPKLTKAIVADIEKPAAGTSVTWDSTVPGFGVRTSSGGTKTFVLKYRTRNEQRVRWLSIARVGDLTLDEARTEATKHRGDIAKGGDPAGDRGAARAALTVSELCDAYLNEAEGVKSLRPNTILSHRSNIDNHIRPAIGRRSAKAITTEEIRSLQAEIASGKTAASKMATIKKASDKPGRGGIVSGGEGAAGRSIAVLGAIFEFARKRKIVDVNPVSDVQKVKPKSRDRYLSTGELKQLGKAMREALIGEELPVGISAARFLLLTGFRRIEALSMKASFVDFEKQVVSLPITKTGKQVRSIGLAAISMLDKNLAPDEWTFPAARGSGHFIGLPRSLENLFGRAGIQGASAHDLRRTYATVAVELGFSELVIAALLGHAAGGVTARYAKTPPDTLKFAADKIAGYIAGLLDETTI